MENTESFVYSSKATANSSNNSNNSGGGRVLVRYPHKTCELQIETTTPYPAVPEEYGALCRGFRGYRVLLVHFKEYYNSIRFRASGNGKNVVCGYIVDKQGYIESIATDTDAAGYATLPLTPDSHALYASIPAKSVNPQWGSVTVQFIKSKPHLVPLDKKVNC